MNERELEEEKAAVRAFLGGSGFFVEVGAHDPTSLLSQTWHLEQKGWKGLLIEPHLEFVELAKQKRPASLAIQAACTSPEKIGRLVLNIPVLDGIAHSELAGTEIAIDEPVAPVYRQVTVPALTLDEILERHGCPKPDFVSIDVEGTELDVLKGFNLERWRPRLILIEDKWVYLDKHCYMTRHGYRLVKRTGPNAWYIPAELPYIGNNRTEHFRMYWKLYLSIWPRKLRKALRMRSLRPLTRL